MHTSSASSASSITHLGDSDPGCGGECVPVLDESAALLPTADQNIAESQPLKPLKMTPVPKLQLAVLCLLRMLEPIGFTQLFPYVNEMVVKLNIVDDPSKAGFVSGLVVSNRLSMRWVGVLSDRWQESIFATFQLMSIYHWAKLSDVVGRRPVVLLGAIGAALMTSLFGFSRNLAAMLVTRSLHGFFIGEWFVLSS